MGHRSRACGPRDVKERTRQPAGSPECESVGATNEGARAPNDRHPSVKSGSLSAPASVALRAEGAVTSSACLWSHPKALSAGLTHQDLWRLRSAKKRCGAPLRDGRPCSVLPRLHSLESTAPASAASFTARQTDDRIIRQPQPGTVPAPHQTLKLDASLDWARRGKYGGGFWEEDKFAN